MTHNMLNSLNALSYRRNHPRGKIALAIALLFIAIVSVASYAGYRQLVQQRSSAIQSDQDLVLSQTASTINRELGFIRHLTQLLAHISTLRTALDRDKPLDRVALTRTFSDFGASVSLVSQIRWLDATGQEQVRVNVNNRNIVAVDEQSLQNKAGRYYFSEGIKHPGNEVYVTPLDLNIEHGVIERPLKPTLRATLSTGPDAGLHDGLLVVNLELSTLFNEIRSHQSANAQVELIDENGFWVLSSNPDREWGNLLDKPEARLAEVQPRIWQALARDSRESNGMLVDNRYWSWEPIYLPGDAHKLWLLVSSDPSLMVKTRGELLSLVLLSAGFLLSVGLWLIYRFYRSDQQLQTLYQALNSEHGQLVTSHQQQSLMLTELAEARKLSSLGMMVAGVAHELNTPVGGALMVVASLKGDTTSNERIAKGLALIEQHLKRISGRITSFKRLATDRSHEEVRPFLLDDVVSDLINSLEPGLHRSRIKLVTDIEPNIKLNSLPGILSQVLQNLIENALSHAFKQDQTGEILVHAAVNKSGDTLQIVVSDNGQGVEVELADTLFDPFVTSGRGRGHTGLGLHLVHLWVHQLLHGKISLDSEPGTGTRFTLEIPRDCQKV